MLPVHGSCPYGHALSLRLADGGLIMCIFPSCPRPYAVTELLSDAETGHLVQFRDIGFTVRHPLRERLDGGLFSCGLSDYLDGMEDPPRGPGMYRAVLEDGIWKWDKQ